jgi:hypothetical protein
MSIPFHPRRDALFAAVHAYNAANPAAPLPRQAATLLVILFAEAEVCCLSQADLRGRGLSSTTLPRALHALVAAGFMSREAGMVRRAPDTYRLRLERLP